MSLLAIAPEIIAAELGVSLSDVKAYIRVTRALRAKSANSRKSNAAGRNGPPLPPMRPDQRKLYTKLRNSGVPRDAAESEALK